MKDVDVEGLLSSYRDSLGSCSRVPERRTRRSWRRPVAVAVACLAVGAVAFVAMKPSDAVAATLQRVGLAIKNARTMEVASWTKTASGTWYEYCHIYYKNGMWTTEARKSRTLEVRHTVRDGKALTDYTRLDHATIEPHDEAFFAQVQSGGDVDALEFVKQFIDSGNVSVARQTRVVDGQTHDGRPAYKLIFERPDDQYHAELLVDSASNLPISADISVVYRLQSGTTRPQFRQDYTFNHAISDDVFSLTPNKPIVDLRLAETELNKAWSKALQKVGGSSIRDACVTEDGAIWIVTTAVFEQSGPIAVPETVRTDNGATYVHAQDIPPSAILAKSHRPTIGGESVVISMFVPLENKVLPSSAAAQFATRNVRWAGFAEPPSSAVLEGEPVRLSLRFEKGDRPGYFPSLDLDHFGFQLGIVKWGAVAEALERQERWLEAARAHEKCAKAYEGFVKYAGYKPLQDAAACYRKAGQIDKADKLEREAAALKASRER